MGLSSKFVVNRFLVLTENFSLKFYLKISDAPISNYIKRILLIVVKLSAILTEKFKHIHEKQFNEDFQSVNAKFRTHFLSFFRFRRGWSL